MDSNPDKAFILSGLAMAFILSTIFLLFRQRIVTIIGAPKILPENLPSINSFRIDYEQSLFFLVFL